MSAQPFETSNFSDVVNGKEVPAGGFVQGIGLRIDWQNGPLGRVGTDERIEPNGAFVETVLEAVLQRIEYYDSVGFGCYENDQAVYLIKSALANLNSRTKRRVAQNVEGTHEGN